MSRENLLEIILSEPCIDTYIRYLGAFKVVESDYGLFDKLARPRDIEDFTLTVYSSIRVQERVLKKLQDGLQRGDLEVIGEVKDVNKAFRIGKECLSKIIEIAKSNPRFIGSIIASLALAYEGIKSKEKRE
ncbi:MAG: hypothetical protein QXX94_04860 [Candidatus Bathyarchaeia archaeon]